MAQTELCLPLFTQCHIDYHNGDNNKITALPVFTVVISPIAIQMCHLNYPVQCSLCIGNSLTEVHGYKTMGRKRFANHNIGER